MQLVAAIAGIASVLLAWIVGIKLLTMARRTKQTPEFLIGLGLLLVGGLWSPLMAAGRQAPGLSDATRIGMLAVGAICGLAGMSCIALFNWRVFRPAESWAAACAFVFAAAIAGLFVAQTVGAGWLHFARVEQGPWTHVTWIGSVLYAWSCGEAWNAWQAMHKRQKLGLADPVVTDRMRLWTWMMLNSVLASAVFGACQQLGIPVAGTTLGMLLGALAGGFSTVFLWLVFMPPATYLESVRRRALVEA